MSERHIRVGDLPDHPRYGVKLYCINCAGEYSATRGDYFLAQPDQLMTCCGRPLLLVQDQRLIKRVTPAQAERRR